MKALLKAILIIFSQTLIGQIKVSDFYIAGGYQSSILNEINNNLSNHLSYLRINFDDLDGFNNVGLGIITRSNKFSKFSIDVSLDYLFHKKQKYDFIIPKSVSKPTLEDLTSDIFITYGDTVSYNYSYQINSLIIGITPSYNLFLRKRFLINLGFGLNYYSTRLNQEGINLTTSSSYFYQSAQDREISSNWTISWQSNITLGLKLSDKLIIDFQVQYRSGKIKNIGAEYSLISVLEEGVPYNESISLFPIKETTIDISGLNYILRFRYHLSRPAATNRVYIFKAS